MTCSHPDRTNRVAGLCKSCYQMDWLAKHPGRRYGVSDEDYFMLMDKQNGVCAICLKGCSRKSRLSIDHDHDTGAVRGLLCDDCNNGLARFGDDAELLARAANYLSAAPTGVVMNTRLKAVN